MLDLPTIENRLPELHKGKKVPPLSKDTQRIGLFHFWGVPDEDLTAEVAVFDQCSVGLIFPVAKDIEKLLARKDFADPTDLDRMEAHCRRPVDENYIGPFSLLLENEFHEELRDTWQQGYAYRYVPPEKRHVRIVLVHPTTEEDKPILKRIARTLLDHFKKEGYIIFDAAPAYGDHAFKRREKQ